MSSRSGKRPFYCGGARRLPWWAAGVAGLCLVFASLYGCQSANPEPTATPAAVLAAESPLPATGTPPQPTATLSLPVTTQTPLPTPSSSTCAGQPGSVAQYTLESTLLPRGWRYSIYLPPCYTFTKQRYPVLYLLHGQGSTDEQWLHLGAAAAADALITNAAVPPFLIVFPYDAETYPPAAMRFGQALLDELIPHIDSRYRTCAGRNGRAIGGISRGAGWAIHLGLSQWQWFGVIGAHSLAIFYNDANDLEAWIEAISPGELPRIYLDTSLSDPGRKAVQEFEALLTRKGVPHTWQLNPGYHEESYWQAHMEEYLRWYGEGWTDYDCNAP